MLYDLVSFFECWSYFDFSCNVGNLLTRVKPSCFCINNDKKTKSSTIKISEADPRTP